MSWPYEWVHWQKEVLPTADTYASRINGGTFIVTGSNTGLGLEAAKALVQQGASKVILAVRSLARGEEAKAKIEAATGIKGVAEVWELDLGSSASVLAFAKKVNALERLDAVTENAAVALTKWSTAEKGTETTIMVNVIGTMLLAGLLLPKLAETAKKLNKTLDLSLVGSGVAHQYEARDELNKIPEEEDIIDYLNDGNHGMATRYPVSKLLLLYAVREWAARNPVASTGVEVNYVNPGLCVTDLARNVDGKSRDGITALHAQIGRTAEEGSRTVVHGMFAGDDAHGKFLSECVDKDHLNPEWITNEAGQRMQKRVWAAVTKRVNELAPGCL